VNIYAALWVTYAAQLTLHRSTSPTTTSIKVKGAAPGVENETLKGSGDAVRGGTTARQTPSAPAVASGTNGQPPHESTVETTAPAEEKPQSVVSSTLRWSTIELPTVFDREKGAATDVDISSISGTLRCILIGGCFPPADELELQLGTLNFPFPIISPLTQARP
jgi:hypothetical protein